MDAETRSYVGPDLVRTQPALDLGLFRRMADMSNDAFYLIDGSGRILYLNYQARKLNGYSNAELQHITVPELMPEFPPQRYHELTGTVTAKPLPLLETVTRHKDGTLTPIETSVAAFTLQGKRYLFGVARDITERKQLEAARRGFAQRMLQTLEAERHRVARELHDDVGQGLATVGVLLHSLQHSMGESVRQWQAEFDAIDATIRQITESVAQIVRDHHPADLAGLGLEDAIRSHACQFTQRHGLSMQLATVPILGLLPQDHELHIYRIVQEALSNVARHARATRVAVRITTKGRRLRIVIRDNGVGLSAAPRTRGFGLANMRERAELIGGALAIRNAPRRGTEVRIDVPLAGETPHPEGASAAAPAPSRAKKRSRRSIWGLLKRPS